MNKEFIPYELALELKHLGFDEECFGVYVAGQLLITNDSVYNSKDIPVIKAPTFSQCLRFFREKHDLFGIVQGKGYNHERYYTYTINGELHPSQPTFDTPEDAEHACLNKLIELVKKK